MLIDPVALARDLVRLDTVNPPGREEACAALLAGLLEARGFEVAAHAFEPGRPSLVARAGPAADGAPGSAPLVLTGHLDTVPLGARPWSVDPFAGEVRDGRLHGRGASDMKAGVAAAIAAAVEAVAEAAGRLRRGLALVLTAAEETGCRGALHLARVGALGAASGLVVAEPTANRLVVAHKGALHLRARTAGRTAHGSMPELGDNAIVKALGAVAAARAFDLGAGPHPLLGPPTLTVTTVAGGENVNSVPDSCAFTLDVRTVPGVDHPALLGRLREALAAEGAALDPPLADLPPVGTDPGDPFVQCVAGVVAERFGAEAAAARGMPYFTDGSALQPAYGGCPTVVLGPGEPGQAHQTDEHCLVDDIAGAAAAYLDVVRRWCG